MTLGAFLTGIGMYPDYAPGVDVIEGSSRWSTAMLNYEYARLVELDRRRAIAERIRIERVLHPVDGSTPRSSARNPGHRPDYPVANGAASTAR